MILTLGDCEKVKSLDTNMLTPTYSWLQKGPAILTNEHRFPLNRALDRKRYYVNLYGPGQAVDSRGDTGPPPQFGPWLTVVLLKRTALDHHLRHST